MPNTRTCDVINGNAEIQAKTDVTREAHLSDMSELVAELSNPRIRAPLCPGQLRVVLLSVHGSGHYCLCVPEQN